MVWLVTQQTTELAFHWKPVDLRGIVKSCCWYPVSTPLEDLMATLHFLRPFASNTLGVNSLSGFKDHLVLTIV